MNDHDRLDVIESNWDSMLWPPYGARAEVAYLLNLARKQQAALDALLYVADNKASDNMIGRWWAGVIKGTINSHMNPAP